MGWKVAFQFTFQWPCLNQHCNTTFVLNVVWVFLYMLFYSKSNDVLVGFFFAFSFLQVRSKEERSMVLSWAWGNGSLCYRLFDHNVTFITAQNNNAPQIWLAAVHLNKCITSCCCNGGPVAVVATLGPGSHANLVCRVSHWWLLSRR